MVITENFAVAESGQQLPRHGLISDEARLPGLTRLADAIKAEGALAVLQIVHAGRYAGPWQSYEARRRLAPSAIPFELTPGRIVTPDEITRNEIDEVVDAFARATDLARRAGFDGVQVHGAQGFLLCEFHSARMNQRTDDYGGDLAGRERFPLRVVDAVVAAAGGDLIVGYHLLSDERMPGGVTVADAAHLAGELAAHAVDFVSPVPTTFESFRAQLAEDPTANPMAYRPEVIATIAAASQIPVFANGALDDPVVAESIVAEGTAAAVMLGRGLLADPDWATKVINGHPEDVVHCPCSPPTCVVTQLTGVVCHSWNSDDVSRGFLG